MRSYRKKQYDRVQTLIEGLDARDYAVRPGRVIPEAGDLPIGEGRTLEATVLFLDISGFSALGSDDAKDQEVMLRALAIFFCEMIRIVQDHGGIVEKNTGDGLMAYFSQGGLGTRSPQVMALEVALTMFDAAEHILGPEMIRIGLEPFQFRVCLDHGTITVAEIGAARRFRSIVAIGNTANIAAKMLARAKPGQLLIGERVAQELPQEWQHFVQGRIETGWVYPATNRLYLARVYVGRWMRPRR